MRLVSHFGQRRSYGGNLYRMFVLAICLACPSLAAWAQSGAGSIQGMITDSMGAAIPNAAIQVKNVDTGVTTDTKSSGVGFYQVPDLFTGKYSMAVRSSGMKTFATSIQLLVGQTAVINPVLSPGAVTQEVTVNADSVQLATTDSGTISATLERDRIEQIPINGRILFTLVGQSTPGMEDSGLKVNGQAQEGTVYLVDGVSTRNDNIGVNNQQTQLLDPDAVQEVRTETTNSSAQFSTPATVLMTTKSGSNTLHGTFFETARNNAFGVARRRQDPANYVAPHLVRNEFGLSAGGPIILPHVYHGKDKSFWFFAYERYSLASTSSVLSTVPTMAMRNGDFGGLMSKAGILQVLYDPATTASNSKCPVPTPAATYTSTSTAKNSYCRTPFAGNVIPASEMSPLAKIYYELIPQPTTSDNPLVNSNLSSLSPQFQTEPQFSFRLDHAFSETDRAYLRFTYNGTNVNTSGAPRSLAVSGDGIDIPAGAAFGYKNVPGSSELAAIGYTHVFSPSFYAETILSQQWFVNRNLPGVDIDKDYEAMLGLPNNFGESGFPTFGTGALFSLGTSQTGNSYITQINTTLYENLTKTISRHQLQFGGSISHTRSSNLPAGNDDATPFGAGPAALYNPTSGTNYKAYTATGYTDASLFLGSATSYNVNLQPPVANYRHWEIAAYLQDNYHFKRNLTFNLGLRYEARPALSVKDGLINTFDLKNDAMVMGAPINDLIAKRYTTQAIITNDEYLGAKFETAQEAGMPSKLLRDYNLNFMPRIGFAYLPFSDKWGTVIRGAFGRFLYFNPLQDYANKTVQNNPYEASYTRSYATAAQAVDSLPGEYLRYNGPAKFGVAGLNTANVVDTTSTTAIVPGVALFSADPSWAPTAVSTTSLTIEQPLKGHSVVRASYIWNHTSNLDIVLHYNHAPSLYQWEMATGTPQPTGGASVIGTPQQNTYASTGWRPYDKTTWGENTWHTRTGWANYNALQVAYQRLYHHGYAYQLAYVFAKSLRAGGNTDDVNNLVDPLVGFPGQNGTVGTMSLISSGETMPYAASAPPPLPTGTPNWASYHDLIKYEQYQQDSGQPTMHIKLNWLVDLPVGRDKKFFGKSPRWLDEIIGGYQIAGSTDITADLIQPTSQDNWGNVAPVQIYKHKHKITDCTSGVCYQKYLWFNGYQAPTAVAGTSYGACTSGQCISGMPASYKPDQVPMDNTPNDTYYQTDEVNVTMADGSTSSVGYDAGPMGAAYLMKTWIHGPINWPVNMALFKVFTFTGRVKLRVNLDAFNAFNMPGENDPGTGGLESFLTSANTARQLQITARLTF